MPSSLACRSYRLAFRAPVRTGQGLWREREGMLLRVESAAGRVGWGEAAPIPWLGGATLPEMEAACRSFGDRVDASAAAGLPGNLACLRNGLAAAVAESSGEAPAAADASALAVAALLPAGRAALAPIAPAAEAGFRTFKWKVGVEPVDDELALLDDVCAALPPGARLRLDPNGAWDRRRAERWLERCAERPIEFVEQPIAPGARGADDLLLGLSADYPTPLALDESLSGEGGLERWLGAGWRGCFVVKPSLFGDPKAALERLASARADVVFSSAFETAVGARAALRLAFAWRGQPRALGFGVWPLFADRRFDAPAPGPFLRREDVERIDPEAAWNALS